MNVYPPDLVRLTVLVVFALLAIDDYRERRVSSTIWLPLVVLAAVLLSVEGSTALMNSDVSATAYAARVAVSIVVVGGLGVGLFVVGAFGMADAKALLVLSLLLPTVPTYSTPLGTLPLAAPPLGVLSLAVVSNALLLACAYPLALAVRNVRAGRLSWRSFVARPARPEELPELHGEFQGVDLDVFRAYLDWREIDARELSDVDEWNADVFLAELDGPRYGTTADDLRQGLDALAENSSRVWVTPGVPFLVPIFAGLVTALTIGDLLAVLL